MKQQKRNIETGVRMRKRRNGTGVLVAALLGLVGVLPLVANTGQDGLPGIGVQPVEYFYTGKPYDADSESYTFRYRNYDPELNRWTTVDPSGFPNGANNQYYSPNPFSEFDWQGLETKTLTASATFSGEAPSGTFHLNQTFSVDYSNGVALVAGVIPTGQYAGSSAEGILIAGVSITSSLALTSGTLVSSQMTADNSSGDPPSRTYSYVIHLQTQIEYVFTGNAGVSFTFKGGTYTIGQAGSRTVGLLYSKTINGSQTVLE